MIGSCCWCSCKQRACSWGSTGGICNAEKVLRCDLPASLSRRLSQLLQLLLVQAVGGLQGCNATLLGSQLPAEPPHL